MEREIISGLINRVNSPHQKEGTIYEKGPVKGADTGFRPSKWGWKSANHSSPPIPIWPDLPGFPQSWACCGGFSWTALDRFYSTGDPPPPVDEATAEFALKIFTTQINVAVRNAAQIADWVTRPTFGHWHDRHSTSYLTRSDEWPRVKRWLDQGLPIPICEIKSQGIFDDFKDNHFVLAWGYREDGSNIELSVYDSNDPLNDGVKAVFSQGGEWNCYMSNHAPPKGNFRGFFCCSYY